MSEESLKINITTQCNAANLSEYNYTGIVRSGYLSVAKGNSVLAFIFYGKKTVTNPSELKSIPTIIWLNGGPGSSSQFGNLQ
jgi:carboxypeptidase C (cathepsin A)